MNHIIIKTSVNTVGCMEEAPILERVTIAIAMVKNMKPHSVTRLVEAHITLNDSVGWKIKSKVHQNV